MFKHFFLFDKNLRYAWEGMFNCVSAEDMSQDHFYSGVRSLSAGTLHLVEKCIKNLVETCYTLNLNLDSESLADAYGAIKTIYRKKPPLDQLDENGQEVMRKANSTLLQLESVLQNRWNPDSACPGTPQGSADQTVSDTLIHVTESAGNTERDKRLYELSFDTKLTWGEIAEIVNSSTVLSNLDNT